MLADNETKTDLLSYEPIATTITALLTEEPFVPITIGVHGDWGAGKSSILEMVEQALKPCGNDFLCIKFNGWRFQGFEDAKISLLETIVEELISARPALAAFGIQLKSIWRRINWLKVAKRTAAATVAIASGGTLVPALVAAEISKAAAGGSEDKWLSAPETTPHEIEAFRREFDELLAHAQIKRLVVLVDDLDRCLPETTVETLEAIRLFLLTAKTAFVVAADEAMVEYCVRHHFPALTETSGGQHYARSYLEKLIQVPFRIPALGVNETRLYASLLLLEDRGQAGADTFGAAATKARELLKKPWDARALTVKDFPANSLGDEARAALSLADQIGPVLSEGTQGNPRQIKRFLNSLLLRRRTAIARGFGGALHLNALAKIMLAERYQPRLFEQIERSVSSSAGGICHQLNKLEAILKTPPEDETEVKATPGDDLVSQWWSTDSVRAWAVLQPPLGEVDLRPYFFITRDRKRSLGSVSALGDLDSLVQQLLGSQLAVGALLADIKKLTPAEHERLFDVLRDRVRLADSLAKQPPGMAGLRLLARCNAALVPRLLDLLEELTPDSLGAWVTTGWGGVIPDEDARFRKVLTNWSEQQSNKLLVAAATAALKIKMKGKKSGNV